MFSRFPNSGADPHRFPPFYGNQWHFSHNNKFLIIKTHSTLKSGQYPVWMTRKPRKGEFRSKNPKKFVRGACPPDPSRILRLRRSFTKSVSIYPRSAPATVFWSIPDPGKLFQTLYKGYHLRLLILTLSFRFLLRYMVRYFQSPLRSHRRAVSSYSTLQQFSIGHFDFTSLGTYWSTLKAVVGSLKLLPFVTEGLEPEEIKTKLAKSLGFPGSIHYNSPRSIYKNSVMTPRVWRQNCRFFTTPGIVLSTKKTNPNIEKWPESLGVMFRTFHKLLEIFQTVSQNFSNVAQKTVKSCYLWRKLLKSCLKKQKLFWSNAKMCNLFKKSKTMISKHFCAILQCNQSC